jgi:hypothetical protein
VLSFLIIVQPFNLSSSRLFFGLPLPRSEFD